ncbi:MAG: Trk system potassium transporter TrkA [bacterium]
MEVIIIGAGQVGRTIATELVDEHEITVVDQISAELEKLPFDVNVEQGDGVDLEVLEDAGGEDADLVISCTSDDRTNILSCGTQKVLADAFTIARVSDPSYVETWKKSPQIFGVDRMVGRSHLSARAITELVGFQSSRKSARSESIFADGLVQMAEFDVPEESFIVDQTIDEADGLESITVGALYRNEELIITQGNITVQAEDRIIVIGEPEAVRRFGVRLNPGESKRSVDDIVILGGGTIGLQTARRLQEHGKNTRLVENRTDRARYLAETLPDTIVLEGDATEEELWEQEQLGGTDMIIVTLRPDERNLMVSLMGNDKGAERVVSVVHSQQNLSIFERADVDMVVHPREQVATEIIQYVTESYARQITSIEHHRGEVYELTVPENSPLIGGSLSEQINQLPEPIIIGSIIRDGRVILPRGDVTVQEDDEIIVLSPAEIAEDVANTICP